MPARTPARAGPRSPGRSHTGLACAGQALPDDFTRTLVRIGRAWPLSCRNRGHAREAGRGNRVKRRAGRCGRRSARRGFALFRRDGTDVVCGPPSMMLKRSAGRYPLALGGTARPLGLSLFPGSGAPRCASTRGMAGKRWIQGGGGFPCASDLRMRLADALVSTIGGTASTIRGRRQAPFPARFLAQKAGRVSNHGRPSF